MSDKPQYSGVTWPSTRRIVTSGTVRDDITAKQLAVLMQLSVSYTDEALDRLPPEQLDLVIRNSRQVL